MVVIRLPRSRKRRPCISISRSSRKAVRTFEKVRPQYGNVDQQRVGEKYTIA